MKTRCLLIVCSFFLISTSFGQVNETQATFKKENPLKFLSKKFYKNIKPDDLKNGQIVISFTLSAKGEILDLFPEKFNTRENALPAIIAIQATNNMWNPYLVDGVAVDKKYKIVFNINNRMQPSNSNLIKADKFFKKGKHTKALKYYNKAIALNGYDADLYQKRAQVKKILNDLKGFEFDSNKFKELKNNVLLMLPLGVVKKYRSVVRRKETVTTKVVVRKGEIKQ